MSKERLINNPHTLDQTYGCCGFAAVLMLLLDHYRYFQNPNPFDELYETAINGKMFRKVGQSTAVKSRIAKRVATRDWAGTLDVKLCVGLMILFKEYVKQKDIPVWNSLKRYSELFAGWQYGDKIAASTAKLPFSYKRGDLALNLPGLKQLIAMVDPGKGAARKILVEHEDLITNIEFKKGIIKGMHTNVKKALNTFVIKKAGGIHPIHGSILGFANSKWHHQDKFHQYDYICHYVYVPRQKSITIRPENLVLWTWGRVFTLKELLEKKPHFSPKALINARLR